MSILSHFLTKLIRRTAGRKQVLKKTLCTFSIALLTCGMVSAAIHPANAQEKRGLFDKIFGTKKPVAEPPKKQKNNKTKSSSRKKTRAVRSGAQAIPYAKPQLQKSDMAIRLLIIGDFIAASVADGLIALYANNPDIIVLKHAEAASGLVRDDYYNWPAQLAALLEAQKPDMTLIALGANDRQSLRLEGRVVEYGSEEWEKNYRLRIGKLTGELKQQAPSKPWLWLGLPPFQKQQLSSSALVFNGYYKEEVAKVGGHFVDIWRGFVDDKGEFNFSGHDVNGQIARLRPADGINFTAAGRSKLAFYANEIIQTLLPRATELEEIAVPEEDDAAPIKEGKTEPPAPVREITYIAPKKLWDMAEDESELVKAPSPIILSPRSRAAQPGRADYFLAD